VLARDPHDSAEDTSVTGLWTVRETAQARARIAAPLASTSVEVAVETGNGLDVHFGASRRQPADLEQTALANLETTAACLPEPLRSRLTVEAGEVRSLLRRNGEEVSLFERGYCMASCRGAILEVRENGGPLEPFHSPWTGVRTAEQIDSTLPVVLAPSAVLALVSYALEVTGSHVATQSQAEAPGMTILDTAASPYPPQHHPFEGDGTGSPDRTLIDEGSWRDREEHAGDDVDLLFFLLTRPERALRPLAAATHFNRRNLSVRCSRTAPLPVPAILIDSWRVRVGPRSGVVPFHAEVSSLEPGGERLAVITNVALQCDPWEVIAGIRGACGPAAPAVDEDPIEGDGYGDAPTLLTNLTFGDLMILPKEP
jgi:hypothetical protein